MSSGTGRKRQLKLLAGMGCYVLLYFAVVNPFLGTIPGFEQPTITGRYDPMSLRGLVFVLLAIPSLLAYVYALPKLSGTSVAEYWRAE